MGSGGGVGGPLIAGLEFGQCWRVPGQETEPQLNGFVEPLVQSCSYKKSHSRVPVQRWELHLLNQWSQRGTTH